MNKRIGYEGLDWELASQCVRLRPVVIANHSKLKHHLNLIKGQALDYFKQALSMVDGEYQVEPGQFFCEASDEVNRAITDVLEMSGFTDDWQTLCSPDDLVRLLIGTEAEPSLIDRLNYPRQAEMTAEALKAGLPYELKALITCMFLVENGDFTTAKEMIESLTPEQLDVITATKMVLLKRANGDKVLSVKHLADMTGVSEETAQHVYELTAKE